MEKRWTVLPKMSEEFKNSFPEIKPVVLQLLCNRKILTQGEIDEFLYPDYGRDAHDPFLFCDMEKAVKRILNAIAKKEKICVYGDYDADGVCATVLLSQTVEILGAKPEVYIPFREKEGYGMNMGAVQEIIERGAKLVITVDCGISNEKEIQELKDKNIDVIVTDHHNPPDKLPGAYAIINPKVRGELYPTTEICGTAVAYKVAQALFSDQSRIGFAQTIHFPVKGYEKWSLDLVAIGTVTDMMILRGESRTLLKYGLIVLNKTRRIGLKALIRVAGIQENSIDPHVIGFQIGPRLNAAGRMGHASTSYELLITKDDATATRLADELNRKNQERQKVTETMFREAVVQAEEQKNNFIIVAYGPLWSPSLVGLVAGKIMEEYHRPVIVMGKNKDGKVVGSGRSIENFNITKALEHCREFFFRFGGHSQACGFTLQDEKNLESFKNKILEYAKTVLQGGDVTPEVFIDLEAELGELSWEAMEAFELFQPFGQGNEKPRVILKNCAVISLQAVGQNGKHLKGNLGDKNGARRSFIGFSLAHWQEKLKPGDAVDIVCEPLINEWNGNREIQLKIIDIREINHIV